MTITTNTFCTITPFDSTRVCGYTHIPEEIIRCIEEIQIHMTENNPVLWDHDTAFADVILDYSDLDTTTPRWYTKLRRNPPRERRDCPKIIAKLRLGILKPGQSRKTVNFKPDYDTIVEELRVVFFLKNDDFEVSAYVEPFYGGEYYDLPSSLRRQRVVNVDRIETLIKDYLEHMGEKYRETYDKMDHLYEMAQQYGPEYRLVLRDEQIRTEARQKELDDFMEDHPLGRMYLDAIEHIDDEIDSPQFKHLPIYSQEELVENEGILTQVEIAVDSILTHWGTMTLDETLSPGYVRNYYVTRNDRIVLLGIYRDKMKADEIAPLLTSTLTHVKGDASVSTIPYKRDRGLYKLARHLSVWFNPNREHLPTSAYDYPGLYPASTNLKCRLPKEFKESAVIFADNLVTTIQKTSYGYIVTRVHTDTQEAEFQEVTNKGKDAIDTIAKIINAAKDDCKIIYR